MGGRLNGAVNDAAFLHQYLSGQRLTALLFIGAGALALLLSLWLLRRRSAWRGMAVPLVLIALLQWGVGGTLYLRSAAQATQLPQWQQFHRDAPAAFKAQERTRLNTVFADLELYRSIELGLLALGMAMAVLLRNRPFWLAFGSGLALQACVLLMLQAFAAARTHEYFKALHGA